MRDLTGDPTLVFQTGKEFSFRDCRLRSFMSIPSPVLEHINRQMIGEHLLSEGAILTLEENLDS